MLLTDSGWRLRINIGEAEEERESVCGALAAGKLNGRLTGSVCFQSP